MTTPEEGTPRLTDARRRLPSLVLPPCHQTNEVHHCQPGQGVIIFSETFLIVRHPLPPSSMRRNTNAGLSTIASNDGGPSLAGKPPTLPM
jgi:hypothetical protein